MKRFLFVVLCGVPLLASPVAEAATRRRAVGATETIVVGGLFSLTSDGATLGEASEAALELDNLFRLATNDRLEGAAVAALMRADGIEVVVPIWRADAGGPASKTARCSFLVAAGGIAAAGVSR